MCVTGSGDIARARTRYRVRPERAICVCVAEPRSINPVNGVHHPVFARVYQRISHVAEAKGGERVPGSTARRVARPGDRSRGGQRSELLALPEHGDRGGRSRTRVVPARPAEEAARSVSVPITILDGTADALPVPDAAFDAGIASLVLCSVPDQPTALAELGRVIRPGGELRFFEHVVSKRAGPARVQRIADRTIRPFLSGGCRGRDTLAAIEAAGFVIENSERFSFRPNPIDVTSPHIVGTARRP